MLAINQTDDLNTRYWHVISGSSPSRVQGLDSMIKNSNSCLLLVPQKKLPQDQDLTKNMPIGFPFKFVTRFCWYGIVMGFSNPTTFALPYFSDP